MTRVAVVRGGIAGLATSVFLARRGHEAVLIERRCRPADQHGRPRLRVLASPGVPQLRQPHMSGALAGRVLRAEGPDVAAAALDGPGVPIHMAP